MSFPLRGDLPSLPDRIRSLPVDERGYPVPWFVAEVDGRPEFRTADATKRARAIQQKLCWVCGQHLGVHKAFVIGPMCSINRVSAEPPSHRECAEFSARACPFLSKPHMRRREHGLPVEARNPAGMMIDRNPGVCAVWVTRDYRVFREGGGVLFSIGEPEAVTWWAEGRVATRPEVLASIDSGMPILESACEGVVDHLARLRVLKDAAMAYLPAAAGGGAA